MGWFNHQLKALFGRLLPWQTWDPERAAALRSAFPQGMRVFFHGPGDATRKCQPNSWTLKGPGPYILKGTILSSELSNHQFSGNIIYFFCFRGSNSQKTPEHCWVERRSGFLFGGLLKGLSSGVNSVAKGGLFNGVFFVAWR